MNKMALFAAASMLLFSSIACDLMGTVGNLTGGGGAGPDLTTVGDLWTDVPRIDGLTKSELEMPFFAKLMMQTMLNTVAGGGTGSGDWIVFSTNQSLESIASFYNPQIMSANGWEGTEQSTCISGAEQGVDQVGLMCFFIKEEATADIALMIIAAPDGTTGNNNLFFVRIKNLATPSP